MIVVATVVVVNVKHLDDVGIFSERLGRALPVLAHIGMSRIKTHCKRGIVHLSYKIGCILGLGERKIHKRHIFKADCNSLLLCHREKLVHKFKIHLSSPLALAGKHVVGAQGHYGMYDPIF